MNHGNHIDRKDESRIVGEWLCGHPLRSDYLKRSQLNLVYRIATVKGPYLRQYYFSPREEKLLRLHPD